MYINHTDTYIYIKPQRHIHIYNMYIKPHRDTYICITFRNKSSVRYDSIVL